jgi:hypothetical protein
MTLASAIDQFCRNPIAVSRSEHPGLRWDLLIECKSSLENRRHEAEQIQQISEETLPLLEEVRDHLVDQTRVNRAIAKIDVLRGKMIELGNCYQLIMQLTQRSELERFKADRKISASKVDGIQRQRRQVERDIDNVRHVVEAARAFQKLMDDTIDHVQQFNQRRREAA